MREEFVGWAKRSVPTSVKQRWWARRKRAFAHPTRPRINRKAAAYWIPRLRAHARAMTVIVRCLKIESNLRLTRGEGRACLKHVDKSKQLITPQEHRRQVLLN